MSRVEDIWEMTRSLSLLSLFGNPQQGHNGGFCKVVETPDEDHNYEALLYLGEFEKDKKPENKEARVGSSGKGRWGVVGDIVAAAAVVFDRLEAHQVQHKEKKGNTVLFNYQVFLMGELKRPQPFEKCLKRCLIDYQLKAIIILSQSLKSMKQRKVSLTKCLLSFLHSCKENMISMSKISIHF